MVLDLREGSCDGSKELPATYNGTSQVDDWCDAACYQLVVWRRVVERKTTHGWTFRRSSLHTAMVTRVCVTRSFFTVLQSTVRRGDTNASRRLVSTIGLSLSTLRLEY